MGALTFCRRMRSRGKEEAAAEFCVSCASKLCASDQYELAIDLIKDLVDFYEEAGEEPNDVSLERIETVMGSIPAGKACIVRIDLLQRALKWSSEWHDCGHPRLHRLAARAYREDHAYGKSQGHLVYCQDGNELADLIQEWKLDGYPNEEHLFSLRALLILLSLNDLSTARSFWDRAAGSASIPQIQSAVEYAGNDDPTTPPTPALQCGCFLLAAAEAANLPFFRSVRAKYALVIRRDKSFDRFLDEIEVRVFGAQPQSQAGAGGLASLLGSLLGGS